MEFYIVRHGIAEDTASGGDAARALTEEGRGRIAEVAAALTRAGVEIDRLYSSPLTRARQTSDIFGEKLGCQTEILDELAPGHSPVQVLRRLSGMLRGGSAMLVGHEPNCSELAGYLLRGSLDSGIQFKKGAVALIETDGVDAGEGTLHWMLTPKLARLIR